jgi:hypothetical protein
MARTGRVKPAQDVETAPAQGSTGRKRGRPVVEGEELQFVGVRLTQAQIRQLRALGGGNVSAGIRRACDLLNKSGDVLNDNPTQHASAPLSLNTIAPVVTPVKHKSAAAPIPSYQKGKLAKAAVTPAPASPILRKPAVQTPSRTPAPLPGAPAPWMPRAVPKPTGKPQRPPRTSPYRESSDDGDSGWGSSAQDEHEWWQGGHKASNE